MGTNPPKNGPTNDYFIAGTRFEAVQGMAAGLYVVATPIGNLKDITIRALETLAAADLVLCEDTRLSARLLDHYGIQAKRAPLHEHNESQKIPQILEQLGTGARIAMISDAGTPLLSDPGFPLVRAARAAGHQVFAIPGPSALLAALGSAGLPTDSFTFVGFLPPKAGARLKALSAYAQRTETLVFYESPRRLGATLTAMAEIFGAQRQAVVALELTKRFERLFDGQLSELTAQFEADDTKGEAVILVAGAEDIQPEPEDWKPLLEQALEDQPLRAAVDEISTRFSLRRKQVYDAALAIKDAKK